MRRLAITALLATLAMTFLAWRWGALYYLRSVASLSSPSPVPHEQRTSELDIEPPAARGDVLLLHGLNVDVEAMRPLAEVFATLGYRVRAPRLAGHRADVEETRRDPTAEWVRQIAGLHAESRAPYVCAGYSLGGLLVLERHLAGELACARFVLFAPALATYAPPALADLIEPLWPEGLLVRSGVPNGYKHVARLGLGTTWGTLRAVSRLRESLLTGGTALPPGVVFIDPDDAVVDATAVIELVRGPRFGWKVVELESRELDEWHGRHLIIDADHVGDAQWSAIVREITSALSD